MEKEKKILQEHLTQMHSLPSEVKEARRLEATLQNHTCFKVFQEKENLIHNI